MAPCSGLITCGTIETISGAIRNTDFADPPTVMSSRTSTVAFAGLETARRPQKCSLARGALGVRASMPAAVPPHGDRIHKEDRSSRPLDVVGSAARSEPHAAFVHSFHFDSLESIKLNRVSCCAAPESLPYGVCAYRSAGNPGTA